MGRSGADRRAQAGSLFVVHCGTACRGRWRRIGPPFLHPLAPDPPSGPERRPLFRGCVALLCLGALQVKLVLQQNKFFVESPHPDILRKLKRDPVIADAAVLPDRGGGTGGAGQGEAGGGEFRVGAARRDRAAADLAQMEAIDLAAAEGGPPLRRTFETSLLHHGAAQAQGNRRVACRLPACLAFLRASHSP